MEYILPFILALSLTDEGWPLTFICSVILEYIGGKSELTELEIWERYIVEQRANYDRLISLCWHIYTNKEVVHVCRE